MLVPGENVAVAFAKHGRGDTALGFLDFALRRPDVGKVDGLAIFSRAQRIAAEYGGPVTNVVFEDGVHILNNIYYKARPLVADWLAEALAERTR